MLIDACVFRWPRQVTSYPDTPLIPARNKAKLRGKGLELCQAQLDACGAVDLRSSGGHTEKERERDRERERE